MSTPAEIWSQHLSDVADLDGEPIFAAVTLDLDAPATVTIRRLAANPSRPQGLVLDADEAVHVGETDAPTVVLWSDTSPAEVSVEVPAGRLTVSHAWRDGDIVHAWTGWAGITRDDDPDEPGRIRLVASDGHDELRADLEVELRVGETA